MYPLKIDEKYEQSNLDNLWHRFTTLYLWNYLPWDFREYVGSHPGVDIFPKNSNDDVFCVLDWKVSKVWEDSYYGKHIFIEHKEIKDPDDFSKTTTLYSCYLHLSETSVNENDEILEWVNIWKTWSTWNSYWEHLHFQIDRDIAPYHCYWPYTWTEAAAEWISFMEWVNAWLGLENGRKYTVNPLVYLDKLKDDITPPVVIQVFNDVNNSYEYYDYLNNLWNSWLIDWNEGNFLWNNNITRAELLKVIFKIKWEALADDNTDYFSDLTPWHKKYVNTAVWLWLLTTSNAKYRPNDYTTRSEVLKIILLYFKVDLTDLENYDYDDISWAHWHRKYVNYSSKYNLIEDVDTNFYPNKYVTRLEVIRILYLLKNM